MNTNEPFIFTAGVTATSVITTPAVARRFVIMGCMCVIPQGTVATTSGPISFTDGGTVFIQVGAVNTTATANTDICVVDFSGWGGYVSTADRNALGINVPGTITSLAARYTIWGYYV